MVRLISAEKPVSMRYRKLANPDQEVRLLEIRPARRLQDAIVSRLITVHARTTDVEFVGLSSLIRDPEANEIIYVDGKPVNITAHRAEALRHMRALFLSDLQQRRSWGSAEPPPCPGSQSPDCPGGSDISYGSPEPRLYVWLDAVCINQRDDDETNRHRDIMRMVYESAKTVLGWLGPETDETEAGLAVFNHIDECMPGTWGDPGDRELHPENYAPRHEWVRRVRNIWQDADDGTPSFLLPHWKGANDFMYRPFFQKQWILQEMCLAICPALLIGDSIVSWTAILRLARFMEEFKDNESDQFPQEYRAAVAELPLGSGYELLRELRKREERTRSIPESEESDGVYRYPNCFDPSMMPEAKTAPVVWLQ